MKETKKAAIKQKHKLAPLGITPQKRYGKPK